MLFEKDIENLESIHRKLRDGNFVDLDIVDVRHVLPKQELIVRMLHETFRLAYEECASGEVERNASDLERLRLGPGFFGKKGWQTSNDIAGRMMLMLERYGADVMLFRDPGDDSNNKHQELWLETEKRLYEACFRHWLLPVMRRTCPFVCAWIETCAHTSRLVVFLTDAPKAVQWMLRFMLKPECRDSFVAVDMRHFNDVDICTVDFNLLFGYADTRWVHSGNYEMLDLWDSNFPSRYICLVNPRRYDGEYLLNCIEAKSAQRYLVNSRGATGTRLFKADGGTFVEADLEPDDELSLAKARADELCGIKR